MRRWLERQPRWTFHFTPTSASWLNAVEGFFATLTKRRLKRGVFRSVADLQTAINRFLEEHNQKSQPFTWTAPSRRNHRRRQARTPSVGYPSTRLRDTGGKNGGNAEACSDPGRRRRWFHRLTPDEVRTLARLRALRSDLIDPTIAVHNGRVFKRTATGRWLSFAAWSMRCAAPSKCKTPWSNATPA